MPLSLQIKAYAGIRVRLKTVPTPNYYNNCHYFGILTLIIYFCSINMTTKETIRQFANSQPNRIFSRKALLSWMRNKNLSKKGSGALVSLSLNQMLKSGELSKEAWGTYSLKTNTKHHFIPLPNNEIIEINNLLKTEFPYTKICVWDPQIIVPFMLHIPNLQTIIVEVEKVAMEPVFNHLQEKRTSRRVIYNPSPKDYAHYVSGYKAIIVKPLITQAPLIDFGGIKLPTLEKIIVDISQDVDFAFAQGAEFYNILGNILFSYKVNLKALYRYAARRGRRKKLENILNSVNYDIERKQGLGVDSGVA